MVENKFEWPQEKLLRQGEETLSLPELLALILRVGTKSQNVSQLVGELLKRFPAWENASVNELMSVGGIGKVKAVKLRAVSEIARRLAEKKVWIRDEPIRGSRDLYEIFSPLLEREKREKCYVLLLDVKKRPIRRELVSIGTLSSHLVHPREVYWTAMREAASSIICVHNHPSGDPLPSQADKVVTKVLERAGNVVGIPLVDHIIVGRGGYYSFADEGLIGD